VCFRKRFQQLTPIFLPANGDLLLPHVSIILTEAIGSVSCVTFLAPQARNRLHRIDMTTQEGFFVAPL